MAIVIVRTAAIMGPSALHAARPRGVWPRHCRGGLTVKAILVLCVLIFVTHAGADPPQVTYAPLVPGAREPAHRMPAWVSGLVAKMSRRQPRAYPAHVARVSAFEGELVSVGVEILGKAVLGGICAV